MELKDLLGAELFAQVETKLGTEHSLFLHKTGEKIIVDDGTLVKKDDKNFVPYSRFKELNDAKKLLDEQIATLSKDLIKLQAEAQENPIIKQKLANIESELTQAKEKATKAEIELSKKYALKEALLEANAEYPDLLIPKVALDSFELTADGKIKDVEKVVKPLTEQFNRLFRKIQLSGRPPRKPDGSEGEPFEGFITKEQFLNMSEADKKTKIDKINESSKHWNEQK